MLNPVRFPPTPVICPCSRCLGMVSLAALGPALNVEDRKMRKGGLASGKLTVYHGALHFLTGKSTINGYVQ